MAGIAQVEFSPEGSTVEIWKWGGWNARSDFRIEVIVPLLLGTRLYPHKYGTGRIKESR
jgi:hypothetical protein